MTRSWVRTGLAVAVLVPALAIAGPGGASPGALAPHNAAVVEELPVFAWSATGGADHYELQVAADSGFDSLVRDMPLTTANTRTTMTAQVANGTYWWRVRAVSKSGDVSSWSRVLSVRKEWSSAPRLLGPVNGALINFHRAH